MPPEVGRFQGVGVAANAPHPYAAVLFVDWLLSDGQRIIEKRHLLPTNLKIKPLSGNTKLIFADPAKMLNEYSKLENLYQQIFVDQAR